MQNVDEQSASASAARNRDATWSVDDVERLYHLPLFELVDRARRVHQEFHPPNQVQLCTLLSIKTGGCAEDCSYCSQSSHYHTEIGPEKMLDVDAVLARPVRRRPSAQRDSAWAPRGVR